MYGAIIGDFAGSIYEFDQMEKVSNVEVGNIIEENSFFSDDTILTIAIMDAILSNCHYEDKLKDYGKKYLNKLPNHKPYFKKMFSPGFERWLHSNEEGRSLGNGAMMRISSVGWLFDSEEEVVKNVILATKPSHNTEEAIESAKTVALIIFFTRNGFNKQEIMAKLNIKLKYRPFQTFNYTCQDTIDNCLYALFTSSTFEESIKKVISYGGDTDTNACIVGSMAEAMYGVENCLIEKAKEKLPIEFIEILNKCYIKIKKTNKN